MPGRASARRTGGTGRTGKLAGSGHALLLLAGLAWSAAAPPDARAHADPSEQIEQVSRAIEQEQEPGTLVALHLRRADLHRLHEDWSAAHRDLERADALSPGSPQVALRLGGLLLDSGRAAEALAVLDPLVRAHPEHAAARVARARALIRLDRREEAIAEYDYVLAATADPHLYLERARAVAPGSQPEVAEALAALRGIDEGIERLGPLVTLQLRAIDLELAAARYDAALARLATVAAQSRRKEHGLARRASILERAGRPDEAAQTYREARTAIESLPRSRRTTAAVAALEEEIDASLARLERPGGPAAAPRHEDPR